MSNIKAKIVGIKEAGQDIRIFYIKPENGAYPFKAGQYTSISIEGFPPRPFSIACAPNNEKTLEVHVKNSRAGGLSSYMVRNLSVGKSLFLTPPSGSCTLEEMAGTGKTPLLFIAGGLGIAPVKALIEDLFSLERKAMPSAVALYWGTEEENEQYIKGHFEDMATRQDNFNFISVVGKLVGEAVIADIADLSGYNIYIAGSPEMVQATIPMLTGNDALAENIHTDDHARSLHTKKA